MATIEHVEILRLASCNFLLELLGVYKNVLAGFCVGAIACEYALLLGTGGKLHSFKLKGVSRPTGELVSCATA